MLVYDITNEKSFDNITNWIENVEEVSTMVVLLGVAICTVHGLWLIKHNVSIVCRMLMQV